MPQDFLQDPAPVQAEGSSNFAQIGNGIFVDEDAYSLWQNPRDTPVVLELHVETPRPGKAPKRVHPRTGMSLDGKRVVTIPPHGKMHIPVEFDQAIRTTREGMVCGGLAHFLEKIGEVNRPRENPALDMERARTQAALAQAQKALLEKKAAEEALAIAQGQLAEQQTRLAEATVAKQQMAADNAPAGTHQPQTKKDK